MDCHTTRVRKDAIVKYRSRSSNETWDDTTLIITGNHGNTEVHTQIRPNIWLMRAGLRGKRVEDGDWRATFHALGGSAFLRVRNDNDVPAVREVLDQLPSAKRALFRILDREELDRLGADPEAPFALAAERGFVIDDRTELPDLQPNPGMSHGHHNDLADMNTGSSPKARGFGRGPRRRCCR